MQTLQTSVTRSTILKTYQALFVLNGKDKSDAITTSQEVDEILYGENGAWRGSHDEFEVLQ